MYIYTRNNNIYMYIYRDVQLIRETPKMPLGSHRGEYSQQKGYFHGLIWLKRGTISPYLMLF